MRDELAPETDMIDIEPRPVDVLTMRTVALVSVARRGMLEVDADHDEYTRETDRFDLHSWTRAELGAALTDRERRLLASPIGELDQDALDAADDALVSAAAIAWALGIVSLERLPLPDDGDAEEQVLDWAPEPWARVGQFPRKLTVRDEASLAREQERWELWYWRAVEAEPGEDGFDEVIAAVRDSGLIPIVGDDLATDAARPFGQLSAEAQESIAWLAELRVRALNWVCGYGDSWDDAPVYPE